jgi:hypothetical protein
MYPELMNTLFTKYNVIGTVDSNALGVVTQTALPNIEVFSVYVKQPVEDEYKKAIRICIESALDVETGQNEFYTPDIDREQFYWYIEDSELNILPAITYNTKVLYRPDIASMAEAGGYAGSADIDMPSDHVDILLSQAAAEAYMDIGQVDMVNMYKNDVNEQLSIIAKKQQMDEKKDEA